MSDILFRLQNEVFVIINNDKCFSNMLAFERFDWYGQVERTSRYLQDDAKVHWLMEILFISGSWQLCANARIFRV